MINDVSFLKQQDLPGSSQISFWHGMHEEYMTIQMLESCCYRDIYTLLFVVIVVMFSVLDFHIRYIKCHVYIIKKVTTFINMQLKPAIGNYLLTLNTNKLFFLDFEVA